MVTVSANKKVCWIGNCGHEWESRVAERTKGAGCSKCANFVSKAEAQIQAYLESFGITVEGSNRTILSGKEIDLWIPSHNVGIELNGIYWHKEKFAGTISHYDKWITAQKVGIQLLQIWEDDWKYKPDLIKRILAHKFKF